VNPKRAGDVIQVARVVPCGPLAKVFRLSDGTGWATDLPEDADALTMQWLLRYGREADVIKHRLTIASVLSSLDAAFWTTTRRRAEVIGAIKRSLDAESRR